MTIDDIKIFIFFYLDEDSDISTKRLYIIDVGSHKKSNTPIPYVCPVFEILVDFEYNCIFLCGSILVCVIHSSNVRTLHMEVLVASSVVFIYTYILVIKKKDYKNSYNLLFFFYN